jgi:feruloyl esterase
VFDTFAPLVQWVEGGVAPEKIVATKYVNNQPSQGVAQTRPLCAYPEVARWTGQGDPNSADNFICR